MVKDIPVLQCEHGDRELLWSLNTKTPLNYNYKAMATKTELWG